MAVVAQRPTLHIPFHAVHITPCCVAGPGSGIAGAAIVSNPLCLHSAAASLSRPWTLPYLYNLGLAIRLRQYTREHKVALSPRLQAGPSMLALRDGMYSLAAYL